MVCINVNVENRQPPSGIKYYYTTENIKGLSLNKTYEILSMSGYWVTIKNDNSIYDFYPKRCFKLLSDIREDLLNIICK